MPNARSAGYLCVCVCVCVCGVYVLRMYMCMSICVCVCVCVCVYRYTYRRCSCANFSWERTNVVRGVTSNCWKGALARRCDLGLRG